MIRFVYGSSASLKSKYITELMLADSALGIQSFLIVPEQFAVSAERSILSSLPPEAQLYTEVLNFSRLYNRVCREYGGLEYNYVTKPTKHLLMWENLRQLSPLLKLYGNSTEDDFTEMMLSQIGELKACCITPTDLENAADKLGDKHPLAKKLSDIALIYASFENLISQSFSDSADDLSKLCDMLCEHDFFKGANVYIDHFTSLTAEEHRIIERIFSSAENVTVTIPLSYPKHEAIYASSILDCEARLKKSAKKHGNTKEIIIPPECEGRGAIKYLAENLWINNKDTEKPQSNSEISLISCSNPYTEAEAAAAYTLELMREGYRCRDIVVIARDAEEYRGIIEGAFEKCDIPFYFSEKTDLLTTPLVKFLLSSLRIKIYNWRTTDVISHLKTGLYNIDMRDIDLFEQYITTWQIKGSAFCDGEFFLNPDGYVEELSPRAANILSAANRVRQTLCDNLCPLFDILESDADFIDKCRALYEFLDRSGAEAYLTELAKKEAELGNLRTAEEYSRLYAVCCDALGEIASALADEDDANDIDTKKMLELITVFFSQTDMGSIPTSADEVVIGSASMLRADEVKCAILIGLCEGTFPAAVKDTGLLSKAERDILEEMNMQFSERSRFRGSDELMYVQRAVELPSKRLALLTHRASADGSKCTPSLPFLRAKDIFPDRFVEYDSHSVTSILGSAVSELAYIDKISSPEERNALLRAVAENEAASRLLRSDGSVKISDTVCNVSSDTATEVFGDRIYLSQSRIDKFVNCNFSYYCTYVLKLREEQISRFKANDIGTFIHYILENLLKEIVDKDGIGKTLSTEQIAAITRKTVDEYILRISPKGARPTGRLEHLYKKLYNLSLVLIRNILTEFEHSSFRPEFFELNTDGKGENPAAMELLLEDGKKIIFRGIIDRVDIYKSEEKVYIRVVDYKTGTKEFSLEDIKHGLNIQMLLYLFTLTSNKSRAFTAKIGGEAHPAGVVYLSSNIPTVELDDYDTEENVLSLAEGELERSGLLISDEEILNAMNDEMSPEILLGAKKKADGTLSGRSLASLEFFTQLEADIKATLTDIGKKMLSGCASAEPLDYKKANPCEWCAMKPICRIKRN